jgi:drug/metabolite transporter (DMT)-like permease
MNGTVRRPLPGLAVAGITAAVSGVSVFVNSYGVHAVHGAAVYTTAKNLAATVVLLIAAATLWGRKAGEETLLDRTEEVGVARRVSGPLSVAQWARLAYVGLVGGGAAFVLFFEGLARTTAEPAAFLHDTLVVWVALLAYPMLRERVSAWNVAAILLLVAGQVAVSGGLGHLVAGEGQSMILLATLLWGLETIFAKQLLGVLSPQLLAVARMGVGVVVLVAFVSISGQLDALVGLDAVQLGWVSVTGLLLAAYVGTWMVALSRARALDVTSVLVASVVVTALLQFAVGQRATVSDVVGLVLVAGGIAAAVRARPRLAPVRT